MATTTKTKTASLKDLVNVAKKQESKDSKPVRPTIELTPEGQEIMRRWVVANVVAKEFSSHEKNVIEEAKSHCLDEYIDSVWALKGHPKNPKFVLNKDGSPDMQGNFQVQSRFTFNIPQHGDDQTPEDALIIKLVEEVTFTKKQLRLSWDQVKRDAYSFFIRMKGNGFVK